MELFLDEPEASEFRTLFGSKLAGLHAAPHVSLAVFHGLDPCELIEYCSSFFNMIGPLNIQFGSVGMFLGERNVVFLAPVVMMGLLGFHRSFHEGLQVRGIRSESPCLPGNWVHHCTISQDGGIRDALEGIRSVRQRLPSDLNRTCG